MADGWRASLWISAGFLALHLAVGAVVPLIGDETYYRLWATGLDWDYYDHPPMIAAMIRTGISVFGASLFGVRVVALLGMAVAGLGVGDIAQSCGVVRARAVLYFNLSLLVVSVGQFATPDAPSVLFWVLSTAAALRAFQGQQRVWWGLAGLAAGLGIMAKFTNLFLGVGYVGWLICTFRGRASLKTSGPYLAVLAAILPVVPLLIWNMSHDMLGFARQFGRIAMGAYTARHLAAYLGELVVLPGPMIVWLALKGVRQSPIATTPFLLWTVAPLLGYFALHSLHADVPGNWLVPVSGVVAVLAAGAASRWHGWAAATTALLSFGVLAVAFNPSFALNEINSPPNQTRGWPAMLAQIPDDGWIATTDYMLTGQLFARMPGRQVWAIADLQRYGFRGAFPVALCSAPGLLIEEDGADHGDQFAVAGPLLPLDRMFGGTVLKRYHLRQVQGVKVPGLCP